MNLQTISQISKAYNLSTRTLRYYEQIGFIKSEKKEDYAYREDAQKVRFDSWPHWPICAFITDRYGIAWTLHN